MPELPEVETLRRSLEPILVGRRFTRVVARTPKLREALDGAELGRRLEGRRVLAVRRRAKYLLVDVEGGTTFVVHLGMSGRMVMAAPDDPPELHEHLVLDLEGADGAEDSGDKSQLRFRDPRRFGLAFVVDTESLPDDRHFAHLGAEPVPRTADETPIDGAFLRQQAEGRRGPVKTFLMDATVVVGVGNIYAAEALYRAGIHPKRSVRRIARKRWDRLAETVVEVLQDAIAEGGTTLNDFRDGAGQEGYFQVSLAVYGREEEPCRRCGEPVRRIVQSNRSTFYCPECQT
jgi:formamidopyrimidine-DNA glycosylase